MATSQLLDKLKTELGAGARQNKYKVFLGTQLPSAGTQGDVLCKSTTFPGVSVGVIEVWNQGRKLVIPGDTSYANDWTLSFYNTVDHKLRKEFIEWMRKVDQFQENVHAQTPQSFMIDMKVVQMLADGGEGQSYTFHNVFPKDIGEISVADDSADAIQEFDVILSFTDWVVG